MPRYITSGANFTPFTYDELVRPVDNMTQAYNAAQEQYDNLATTTAQLERYISDNPDDEETRNIYNNYMSVLQNMQDSLGNEGYSTNTARNLSKARKMYGQQIVPMSEAIQRRRDWNDKYLQMQMEHPEMIMGRAPGSYSVKDYMNDTNFGGFKNYSSAQLTSDASAAAKAAASALEKRPRTWTTGGNVPPGYYETEMTTGYTEQEVEDAIRAFRARQESIAGDGRANDLLQIAKDIYSKSGIGSWETDSDDIFNRAADAIGTGLRSGIGETKYEMVQRRDGEYSPNYNKPTNTKTGNGDDPQIPPIFTNPRGLEMYVDPDIKKQEKKIEKYLQIIKSTGDYNDISDIEAYGDAANFMANYKHGSVGATMQKKRYNEVKQKYPELDEMNVADLLELAKFKKLSKMYDEYGLEGEDRTIDNLYSAISDEKSRLVLEYRNPTLREEHTGEVMKLFDQNTIDRNNSSQNALPYAHYKNGKPLSTSEFNSLIADDKGNYLTNNTVQIIGHEGKIRITPVNGKTVYLDPSLISNIPMDEYSAYNIVQGFVNDNYYNKNFDKYLETAAREMMTYIDSSWNGSSYDPAAILGRMPQFLTGLKAKLPITIVNAIEGSLGEALGALITIGTVPLPNPTTSFTNPEKY